MPRQWEDYISWDYLGVSAFYWWAMDVSPFTGGRFTFHWSLVDLMVLSKCKRSFQINSCDLIYEQGKLPDGTDVAIKNLMKGRLTNLSEGPHQCPSP